MNRNSVNRFSLNPTNIDMQRSIFNRDHSVKFSFNVGDVIPFYVDEVLPGDTFTIDTNKVVRIQPLVTPIMDEIFLDTYYFFVPNRLVWDHWINFMGENTDGPWKQQTEYNIPRVSCPKVSTSDPTYENFPIGSVADYMGIPTSVGNLGTNNYEVNALPFRAYALICDQWFRSENLQNPVNVPKDDKTYTGTRSDRDNQVTGPALGLACFKANKTFDYFTSCLPEPQKGPDVSFLNGLAPVMPSKEYIYSGLEADGMKFKRGAYNSKTGQYTLSDVTAKTSIAISGTNSNLAVDPTTPGTLGGDAMIPVNLWADLSNSMFSINELRNAFAIQRYYEKLARGGSRYIEMIKAFFGVTSPDSRLQRSEYLGGSRLFLNVQQVEQTSATEEELTPQGNLTGISVTNESHSDFTKSFTEHGYVIGVCVARYNHTYQKGAERHWFRKTLFDFYNPSFANLGEQPVYNREIFLDGDSDQNEAVFGYQEAWAEYRYKPNRVAGEMRSGHSNTLDSWHLADNPAVLPLLSDGWLRESKAPLDRCLAVSSSVSHQLIADFYIACECSRPMPLYSIPGLIDHN